jgi:hypothetical protein
VNPETANGFSAGLMKHALRKINSDHPYSSLSQSQGTGACPSTEIDDRLALL